MTKKTLVTVTLLAFMLSACLPDFEQQAAEYPIPISEADLQATAAVLSQETLAALPTATMLPSETPVVVTATETPPEETPTETPNPVLLTLTATLGTGTVTAEGTPDATAVAAGTSIFAKTPSPTHNPLTPTGTIHPQFYGTLPPHLAYGNITLINKGKVDVYISLQCTTKEGYTTILEYPVKSMVDASAPAGKYKYVAWVGGRQFIGNFSLAKDQDLTITIFKDRITIKN
ncbi:MAG: hypothetical protein C4557_04820 [Anaerolineaceae bacterium]|jgi:hypothetical protein|nr:MAG: hypothetical protein C4557_04820 [Anaerolineaceae bacterium]